MKKPNALTHFRGESGYNCVQAVLKAYASRVDSEDAHLEQFATFGGGRVPPPAERLADTFNQQPPTIL